MRRTRTPAGLTEARSLRLRMSLIACAFVAAGGMPGCSWVRDYQSRVIAEEAFASGAKALEQKKPKAAKEDFDEALREQPNSASLNARIGLAYMPSPDLPYSHLSEAQAKRAWPYLRRAIELDPRQPALVYLEAILAAVKTEHQDDARGMLSRAAVLFHDDPMALNEIGYLLADADQLTKEAEPLLERAVELRPHDGMIIDSLGWVRYRLGNLRDAERLLRRAADLLPDDPEVQYHLGVVKAGLGKTDQARTQFRRALELDPEFAPARAALRALPHEPR